MVKDFAQSRISDRTVKALLNLPRAYLISYTPEGSLSEKGVYSLYQMARICMIAFQFFTPHFADITCNLTSQINKFYKFSLPNTIKTNMQACLAKYMENRSQSLDFDISGGGGLNREEGLIKERGHNRALFTVFDSIKI